MIKRDKLHEIIFEAETTAGKAFDITLLIFIVFSVVTVMLETVPSLHNEYGTLFLYLEYLFTFVFTIEYILRLYITRKPMKYAKSFYGVVDLLSILPTYLSFFIVGSQSLMMIRALRLLRVFRIFKLGTYMSQGQLIIDSLKESRRKIFVFLFFILVAVCIFGSIMYLIEGGINESFDSIPRSIYWAIVTLTTVGYGDISPITPFGQIIASIIMVLGYSVIAVPTGIISADLINESYNNTKPDEQLSTEVCRYCSSEGHDQDALHCKYCGEKLNEDEPE